MKFSSTLILSVCFFFKSRVDLVFVNFLFYDYVYKRNFFYGFINMLKYMTKFCTIELFRHSCTGGREEPNLIMTDYSLKVLFINILSF